MPLSHSDLLWSKIRLAEPRLTSATNRFWKHPDLAELLPTFLIQLHRVMQGGITLMRVVRDQALSLPNDPAIVEVQLYRPRWTGTTFVLDFLASVPLP